MPKSKPKMSSTRQQFGVIPFRHAENGAVEILLVTSRETARWVIPKGWPIKNKKPVNSARIEALEEAGVKGVGLDEIGSFDYVKRMTFGRDWLCQVRVFPLRVTDVRDVWPEMAQRERRWFSTDDAVEAVQEPGLADILRALPDVLRARADDVRTRKTKDRS